MLVPSEHDKPMFGLPSTFIFHHICRTLAQVNAHSWDSMSGKGRLGWWEQGHGVNQAVWKLCWEKWQRARWWIHDFGWAHEGNWGCFREEKNLQQPWNMLGEYKTENYSKTLIDLIWACAPYCLILEQKFIHGEDKHWQWLRQLLNLLWHNGQWEKSCLEELHQLLLSII